MALSLANDDGYAMETTDALPSQLLIKIESFSLLGKHGIEQYESGEFEAGGCKWRLTIYLKGEHISADFAMVGTSSLPTDWEVNAIFSIFLYNQLSGNYLRFRGKVRRFDAIKSKWELPKFISKKSFMDPSKGFLVEDICVFGAEVFVSKRQRVFECVSVLNPKYPDKCDFKISNFSKLDKEWNSEEFTAGDHKWIVVLYPNGKKRDEGRNVSIYLKSVDSQRFGPHEKLKAKFCLRVNDRRYGQHCACSGCHWFTSSENEWGWPAFMPVSDMRDPDKGFVVNDCCFLETEISVQAVARDAP